MSDVKEKVSVDKIKDGIKKKLDKASKEAGGHPPKKKRCAICGKMKPYVCMTEEEFKESQRRAL